MMRVSIRQRLTVWYAAALLTGLAIFAFGMWVELRERLTAGVDGRLTQRIHGLESAVGPESRIRDRVRLERELGEFAVEMPDGSLIQLRSPSGEVLLPSPGQKPLAPPAGRTSPYSQTVDGRQWRVAVSRMETGGVVYQVQAAIALDEVESVMGEFLNLLLLLVPGVLVVSCLGGYWLSSRALRPVDEITTVALGIGVQNLSQRVAVPQTGDELQRMAEAWNDVLERLEVAIGRIRQFTSDASHELRTPLALIRATAELALRRERSSNGYRESIRQIELEAEHMTLLTESLLTLARSDAGSLGLTLQPTELGELVHSVVQQSIAVALKTGVLLEARANGPLRAAADPSGIRRILMILVDNALKHTPPGGAVTVSAEADGGLVTLAVEDTGEGISEDALPHIFERFYRADPARAGGSGFGLGLSIAQAIAQAHGSTISARSRPGCGARFSMVLKSDSVKIPQELLRSYSPQMDTDGLG